MVCYRDDLKSKKKIKKRLTVCSVLVTISMIGFFNLFGADRKKLKLFSYLRFLIQSNLSFRVERLDFGNNSPFKGPRAPFKNKKY